MAPLSPGKPLLLSPQTRGFPARGATVPGRIKSTQALRSLLPGTCRVQARREHAPADRGNPGVSLSAGGLAIAGMALQLIGKPQGFPVSWSAVRRRDRGAPFSLGPHCPGQKGARAPFSPGPE
uniref:Uncharacterized protein n=1 Tax=Pelusios castaneus TaxID=367368 RepID=A0A8C8RRH6_9SAUR